MTSSKAPDRARIEAAFAQLLDACGLDHDDPNLTDTPRRAASAWVDRLLHGYTTHPRDILSERYPSEGHGAVVVTRIPFISTCPHHLLPRQLLDEVREVVVRELPITIKVPDQLIKLN